MEPPSPGAARFRAVREISPEGRQAPLDAAGARGKIRQKGGMITFVGFVMLAFVLYNVGEVRTAGLQQQASRADAAMRALAPQHGQEALQNDLERELTGDEKEGGGMDSIAPDRKGIQGAQNDDSESEDKDGIRESKANETGGRDGAEEGEGDTLGKSEDRGQVKFAGVDNGHYGDGDVRKEGDGADDVRKEGDGADDEEGGQEERAGQVGGKLSPTVGDAKVVGQEIEHDEAAAIEEDGEKNDADADGEGRPSHRDDDQNHEERSNDEEVQVQGGLLEWLRNSGAEVGPVSLGRFSHSGMWIRGLQANEDLSAGAVVFRIPAELILAAFDVDWEGQYGSKSLGVDDELPEGTPPQDVLSALRIAEERKRGDKSRWRRYLEALPSKSDYMAFHPLMAAEKDFQGWEELPTVKSVLDARLRISKEFKRWHLHRFLSWEELWYCYVIGMSRAYHTHKPGSEDAERISVLVPGVDMGNTDVAGKINTGWGHHRDRNEFVLETLRAVKHGEELLQAYQDASDIDNAHLAYMFGMVLHNNPVKVQQMVDKSVCRKLLSKADKDMHDSKLNTLLLTLALQHCQASGVSEGQLGAFGGKGEMERDVKDREAADKAGATGQGTGRLVPIPVNSKRWPYFG